MKKTELRGELLSKLTSLPHDELKSLNLKLTNQLLKFFSLFPELSSQVGGAYLPLQDELAPIYPELLNKCFLDLAYPVLIQEEMLFALPDEKPSGRIWLRPPYTLVEPKWLLVPGVGFDLSGGRLGRGKGFYDRYLDKKDLLKVGIAWSEQVLKKIPMEHHDASMDYIITESFCWSVAQQKKI